MNQPAGGIPLAGFCIMELTFLVGWHSDTVDVFVSHALDARSRFGCSFLCGAANRNLRTGMRRSIGLRRAIG